MNKMNNMTRAAFACLAALAAAGPAGAATTSTGKTASAPALCQPALPTYDGLIRKRPLAVQNEGNSAAFVSCALIGDTNAVSGTSRVFLYLINNNAAPATIACTLVNSHAGGVFATFPKSVEVAGNSPGGAASLEWTSEDNGGSAFSRWTSISCNLPAGTGIGHLGAYQEVNIGT